MRFTHHFSLTRVTRWVRLKFSAMNLKKLAIWSWRDNMFPLVLRFSFSPIPESRFALLEKRDSLTN